jgi:tetratricopeptide (TPR) repeat protein
MIVALDEQAEERFGALNEYDWRYTVGHLITAASEQQKQLSSGSPRDARLLVRLLVDPAFALAQAAVIGAEATVADFAAGHDAVSLILPSEAPGLSRALATAAIESSVSGKAVLTPDVLNALLTYRTDTEIYGELLDFATDEKVIAEIVPGAPDRLWLMRAFLHNAATRCRRLGGKQSIDRAREMLSRARDAGREMPTAQGSEDSRSERVLSSILYDLAYIDYLTERPSAAREGFRASAEAAKRARNTSGYYISRLLEYLVGFYDGVLEADDFRALLEEALVYFTRVVEESPHAERWVMNAHAHLFDLACLVGDASRADAEFAVLQRDPWVLKFHQFAMVKTWRARDYLAHHAWDQAVALYKSILEEELSQPEENLVREGIARDLLDYGTALAGQGSTEMARQVWERGLRSSDYAGGWPWKTRISHRLAKLGF